MLERSGNSSQALIIISKIGVIVGWQSSFTGEKIMTFTHAHEVQNAEELYKVANRYEYVMRMDEATDKLEDLSYDIDGVMNVINLLEELLSEEKTDDRIISTLELVSNKLERMPKILNSVVSQYLQGTQKGTKKFEEEERKFHQNNEG